MTKSELVKQLEPLAEDIQIWLPVFNGHVVTYGVLDSVYPVRYASISNDFFGTPGRMDKRLFDKTHTGEETIALLSSDFSEIPNKNIDFGSDDIDYDIKTINGDEGDEDFIWKLNDFTFDETRNTYHKEAIGDCSAILWSVSYNKTNSILSVDNYQNDMHFSGRVIGIETLRNIISTLKLNLTIWS
jgi:hypothetical protein